MWSNLYTRLCFCIELYFNTCCRLIIEMIFKTKPDLGVMKSLAIYTHFVSSRCFRHRLGCDIW
ncbi:hypothetical protein Hanom_Chr00s180562g01831741 [Helianthus anomalus]